MNHSEVDPFAPLHGWLGHDIAVVALRISHEYPKIRVEKVARAVGVAAAHVSARKGRSALINTARTLLQEASFRGRSADKRSGSRRAGSGDVAQLLYRTG